MTAFALAGGAASGAWAGGFGGCIAGAGGGFDTLAAACVFRNPGDCACDGLGVGAVCADTESGHKAATGVVRGFEGGVELSAGLDCAVGELTAAVPATAGFFNPS